MKTISSIASSYNSIVLLLIVSLAPVFVPHWPADASSYVLTGGPTPPAVGPAPGEDNTMLARGLFSYSKTDLTVAAPIPLAINRTYRSRYVKSNGNPLVGTFGNGTNLNYDIYLYSATEVSSGEYNSVSVVLPDGSQIACTNTSPTCTQQSCSDYQDAHFVCNTQPIGAAFASVITYNAGTTGWNWTLKDGTVYSFGHAAPLLSVTDRYSNSIALTRCSSLNGAGMPNVTKATASNQRSIALTYTDSPGCTGMITKVTDGAGREVDYAYAGNQLQNVTYPNINDGSGHNPRTVFTWGSDPANIVNMSLVRKVVSGTITYDGTAISYGGQGNVNAIYPSTGQPSAGIQYTYTFYNNTSPNVETCTATFSDGTERIFTYNTVGYLTDDKEGAGSNPLHTVIGRDSDNRITSVQDTTDGPSPTTRTTTLTYDSLGNIMTVALAGVGQTAYTYDSTYNQVKTITNALNKTWTFTLDSQQKSPIAVTDPLGHTTNAAYNAQGQITSITDPLHNPATTFGYASPSDDLASVADPMGNVTSFVTDNVGRVTSATSPLRETSSYIYDDRNDLVQATDPMGLQTSYTYNLEGLITSVTDSNNNKTTFDWTPPLTTNEWNLQVCNPVHACDQYLIANISGALDDHFDKNGLETKYTYDNRGRRIKTQYDYNSVSGYNPWTSHYSWDGERLTEVKSYNGSTLDDDLTMTYDTLG